jgi:hypothetical protein
MPGNHVTVDRIARYRCFREGRSRVDAARLASLGVGTAQRIDQGIHFLQRPELATRVDRRITKISADWSVAASQYIESHLEAPAKAVSRLAGIRGHVAKWRIAAANRPPEHSPAASGVRGIAAIRDRVIFGNSRAQGRRGHKRQQPLMAQGFLACLIILLDFCTAKGLLLHRKKPDIVAAFEIGRSLSLLKGSENPLQSQTFRLLV